MTRKKELEASYSKRMRGTGTNSGNNQLCIVILLMLPVWNLQRSAKTLTHERTRCWGTFTLSYYYLLQPFGKHWGVCIEVMELEMPTELAVRNESWGNAGDLYQKWVELLFEVHYYATMIWIIITHFLGRIFLLLGIVYNLMYVVFLVKMCLFKYFHFHLEVTMAPNEVYVDDN